MYCKLWTIFQWTETGPSYLRASLISNKSGRVVWSSFKNKKRIKSESLLCWDNKRLYFDQGTESVVLITIFV